MIFSLLKKILEKDQLLIITASLLAYILYALAFPLTPGRDFGTYLQYYFDILSKEPTYHLLMVYRTPGTPLFYGILGQFGGSLLVEVVLGFCYISLNLIAYNIVKGWDRVIAFLAVFLIIFHFDYNLLFHHISSDNLFSIFLMFWVGILFIAYNNSSPKMYLISSVVTFLLVMIRPSSQLFVFAAFLPLLSEKVRASIKIKNLLIFFLVFILLILFYRSYNFIRYGDFTVSRGGAAVIPLYRLFTVDRIVRPENGIYSEKLANDVKNDLLTQEPYKTYQIDVDTFFTAGDPRMMNDLISFSDRKYGWNSNYKILGEVSKEAIFRYPKAYIYGVINTLIKVFEIPGNVRLGGANPITADAFEIKYKHLQKIEKLSLPIPSEDSLIPGSFQLWFASNAKNEPVVLEKQSTLGRKVAKVLKDYPSRQQSKLASNIALQTKRLFRHLPIFLFVAFAIIGNLLTRKTRDIAMLYIIILSLLVLTVTYMGLEGVIQYRLAFDPLFIIAGMIGFYNFIISFRYYVRKI